MVMSVICNPENFDKVQNFIDALHTLQEYATRLELEVPAIDVENPVKINKWTEYGFYCNKSIFVNVHHCRNPAREPIRVWTFTGYKTDLTPAGVLSHEFGHYVDDMKKIVKIHRDRIIDLWQREGCVSSYCPNSSEWFAETFRLWFLNPDLLASAKPETAQFMLEIGFPKSHEFTWRHVLQHAHPKLIVAAENFIKNGIKQNRLKVRKSARSSRIAKVS